MTPSTPPAISTGQAVRELLRDRRWWVWLTFGVAWFGFGTWSDWLNQSRSDKVTFAALGVSLMLGLLHRQVREQRGLGSPHWATPLVVGAAALVVVVVANVAEPVMSVQGMAIFSGGLTVVAAVITYAEARFDSGRSQGRPRSATGGPR